MNPPNLSDGDPLQAARPGAEPRQREGPTRSREQRRERGSGSLFQEWYRDARTGEKKKADTWTMKLWFNGKALKKSSGETSVYRANKRLAWKIHESTVTTATSAPRDRRRDLLRSDMSIGQPLSSFIT